MGNLIKFLIGAFVISMIFAEFEDTVYNVTDNNSRIYQQELERFEKAKGGLDPAIPFTFASAAGLVCAAVLVKTFR